MEDSGKPNLLWPAVDTESSARKLLWFGVGAALITSAVTGLAVVWAMWADQKAFGIINAWAIVDIVFFLAIAFGIYKASRIAAICGLLLFLLEKASQIHQTGRFDGAWMAATLALCYVHAIRGAFALAEIRKQST